MRNPLDETYMENLSLLFQLENNSSLTLDNVEFADKMNVQFLEILKCEAAKENQEFWNQKNQKGDKLFTLVNSILEMNEGEWTDYSFGVIIALATYTTAGQFQLIPARTIMSLENVMIKYSTGSDEYKTQMAIIRNVIRNGQRVSDKSLQIFADILFKSDFEERRLEAFMMLDKSMNNQPDLPEDIFCITELRLA